MDLFFVNELAFIHEQMEERLREAQETYSTIVQNEFNTFERIIDHMLNKEMGNKILTIHSISNKYSQQTHSRKRTTVLEERMKRVKKQNVDPLIF